MEGLGSHLIAELFECDEYSISDAAKVEKIASVSKYTEQDYLNSVVKCIDPKLESIFGRTGAVIQIIPYDDFIELDVKFGRGLGNVRLTEKQIEIVPV